VETHPVEVGDKTAMQIQVLVDGVGKQVETETSLDEPVPLSQHLSLLLTCHEF